MTKSKKILLSALAVASALGIVSAVSCGNKKADIAVMMTDPENPRWILARNETVSALEKRGFTVAADQKKEQEAQNAWVKTQIESGVKGIIIGASNAGGAAKIIADAQAAKIPVVAYDRLIPSVGSTYNWYTTFDNYRVGEYQGLSFLSGVYKFEKDGKPAIFSDIEEAKTWVSNHKLTSPKYFFVVAGDPGDNNAPLFYKGAMSMVNVITALDTNLVSKSESKFESVAVVDWKYENFREKLKTQLKTMSDAEKSAIVGVVSPNDGMAQGAIQAFEASGVTDFKNITITGQDSNPTAYTYIKEGKQYMTIAKPDARPAQVAAILLKAIIDKGSDITVVEAKKAIDDAKLSFTVKITADDENYKAESKFIKTVIIDPKVITKANVEEIKPA